MRRLAAEILDAVVVGVFVSALWQEWRERRAARARQFCPDAELIDGKWFIHG
jgi:hypothetical protein